MPTVLELCAGAGGQALGYEGAGFDHAALLDNEAHACATLRMNRPYWNVIEADIRRMDFGYWHHAVDVVAAGLPCPPFSVAGKQHGAADDRDLFPTLLRVVEEVEPSIVMVENVRGLTQRRFAEYRATIIARLREIGFPNVAWRLLNAHDYGSAQNRTRSFLVASEKEFKWPAPTAVEGGPTVGEALADMMGENGWERVTEWASKANRPAPTLVGGSLRHGGPDLGPTRARAAWAALGVDGLGIADEPPYRCFAGTPRLTVEMTAKLQSFPESWAFAGSKTQKYRQIGNALTVDLGTAMAGAAIECLAR